MISLRAGLSSIAVLALAVAMAACTSAGTSGSPSGRPGISGGPGASSAPIVTGIAGTAIAGPTCPVQKVPPDPSCAPRPVTGAVLVVRDSSGTEVARLTTDAAGAFQTSLPAGAYVVMPQAVTGLMGTAPEVAVIVKDRAVTPVEIAYDTGIR